MVLNDIYIYSNNNFMIVLHIGLRKRSDYEQVHHIPIGALPGGSANAIVKNLCDKSGEENTLESACNIIAKGRSIWSDLMCIER